MSLVTRSVTRRLHTMNVITSEDVGGAWTFDKTDPRSMIKQ
jgi:hypothetical protein